MSVRHLSFLASAIAALAVAACGGGGSTPAPSTGSGGPTGTVDGADAQAVSSGAVTAFGSVFVNGHEFATTSASTVDDDTGATTAGVAGVEVGQVVDVDAAASSTGAAPVAARLHVHPLVRGNVDAEDAGAQTLTVMGQSVQLDASTVFSDHRACVSAASNPCTPVTGLDELVATTGSGAAAVAGSYVQVDGYLFEGGAGSTNVVASLVAVFDAPAAGYPAAYKAEGPVSAVGPNAITIGGLVVSTAGARCFAGGTRIDCASAFSVGQVASAFAAAPPALPATTLAADAVLRRDHLPVTTPGATVELEGAVSAVTSGGFTLRGTAVDTTALPAGTVLPVAGDLVTVTGTLSSSGTTVVASALRIVHAAAAASLDLEADVTAVAPGSTSGTYTVTVMGQAIGVDASTRLEDQSRPRWFTRDQSADPFNIATFQAYLAASASQHVLVRSAADASGRLHALMLAIVPAAQGDAIAGQVDASPAPVTSATAGTPSTLSIHGIAVRAAPAAVTLTHHLSAIAAGDEVVASGSFASGTLTVAASPRWSNYLLDFGPPRQRGFFAGF